MKRTRYETHEIIAWPGKGPQAEASRVATIMRGTEEDCRDYMKSIQKQETRDWTYRIVIIEEE